MANKSADQKGIDQPNAGTALQVVITPHEEVSADRSTSPLTGAASVALATASAVRLASSKAAAGAKQKAQALGRATSDTAIETYEGLARGASVATKAATAAGKKAAAAAGRTLHEVTDLNGDGRFDVEDVRIAKAAVGKVAVEVGDEAMRLGKSAMRHSVVKDAAAGALVGGVIATAVPFVGVGLGAALGAAALVARGNSNTEPSGPGKLVGKGAASAATLVKRTGKPRKSKPSPR